MEIKTSEQIFHSVNDGIEKNKKWVTVESLLKEFDSLESYVGSSLDIIRLFKDRIHKESDNNKEITEVK